MNGMLRKIDTILRSAPCALLSFFGDDGQAQVRPLEWVGVICSEPAILSVCLKRSCGAAADDLEGGDFVVNLPGAPFAAAEPSDLAAATTGGAETVSAPIVADAPLRLECRRASVLHRFERTVLSGTIAAVHIAGRTYGHDAPPDIYRLAPFAHPLIVSPAVGHNLEKIWSDPLRAPENATCF